jgi:chorismate mutase/prephenate dehydratase
VEKGRADYGVVPIENSIEGAVNHTLDMFIDSRLLICSEVYLEISHSLLSNSPKHKIRRIYSNPQVFGQCRMWLEANLPRAELVKTSSTTRAAQIASRQKNSAAIASILAARKYGLEILKTSIEDSAQNVTRFLVVGKHMPEPTRADKTSVVFSIKDKVGALHDILAPFKRNRINLTKIESRPSKLKPWDYYFFVDFHGHCGQRRVKRALKSLEKYCIFLKILGSYPSGDY